ncbi:hypothetical protein AVI51_16490 (plasmid) [Piscirickettsia salmonis]|uniref:MFS transporter n=1 Tax=Piscirickettsia salmonis TaxID=1238 RepID=UPI0006BC801C|nr:MFS transporter [Piscirickettsia salmonis]RNC77804.1 MFS transporter [Piscirickettsiaceae bacterium NZ-RLO2]ALA26742.1 sugar (and other) transporter family protein [Piscirickettsia salmonis]APS52534.1 hypothetical protein AVI50_16925 [Piscirickettsia salmonis]APS55701.1 hypothetical protein AVI51_16490 [Piscirickettsia salmonis]QGP34507.1 Proline porter II [Piscirickettsia salmonis]
MNNIKTNSAIVLGTILQWYQFSLYAVLSPIIAVSFFPKNQPYIALISTWLTFGLAWLFSPLGGIIFGYIGDKYGRKSALMGSMLVMIISTSTIAFLPKYQTIGAFSPIILALSLALQGLSASAEYNAASVYLVENAKPRFKALFGCLPNISNSAGMMLGASIGSFFTASYMPPEAWRVPFFVSGITAILCYYLRSNMKNYTFIKNKSGSLRGELNICSLPSLQALILAAYNGITSWGVYVWGTSLMVSHGLSISKSSLVISVGLLLDIIIEPVAGLVASKVGNTKLFLLWSTPFALCMPSLFSGLASGSFTTSLISMIAITFLLSPPTAMINSIVIMKLTEKSRALNLGVSWNIGMTIFGGTAPLVCTLLLHQFHSPAIVGTYLSLAIIFGIIIVWYLSNKESFKKLENFNIT